MHFIMDHASQPPSSTPPKSTCQCRVVQRAAAANVCTLRRAGRPLLLRTRLAFSNFGRAAALRAPCRARLWARCVLLERPTAARRLLSARGPAGCVQQDDEERHRRGDADVPPRAPGQDGPRDEEVHGACAASFRRRRRPRSPITLCNPKRACGAQAHDELNACGPGDLVRLTETRPLSRHKRCVACVRLSQACSPLLTRSRCPCCFCDASQLDCRGDSEAGTHVRAGRRSARASRSRKSARRSSARGSVSYTTEAGRSARLRERAERAVACVTQSWHDAAALVQHLVDHGNEHAQTCRFAPRGHASGGALSCAPAVRTRI